MSLPWANRLREGAVALVMGGILLGVGYLFYEAGAPVDAPVRRIDATVAGFGIRPNGSRAMMTQDPRVLIDFTLKNGRRVSGSVSSDQAERCRVGQPVELSVVTTRGGFERIVVRGDLCGR